MRGNAISASIPVWIVVCGGTTFAQAELTISDSGTYVVDRAGVVDPSAETSLNGWLRELEQKTTAQVKVLTVPTAGGEDFFTFVHRHAELWRLGRKGADNGVLIAVAIDDREMRIHVGYGLEAVLPDSWCGSLRREIFNPAFREGRFSQGIFDGTLAIANKIADDAKVTLTGAPRPRSPASTTGASRGARPASGRHLFLPAMIILIIVLATRRRRGYRRRFWYGGPYIGGSWGSGGFRGGFGRGFGGFGGGGFGGSFGGGGRFGGGGSGGRW